MNSSEAPTASPGRVSQGGSRRGTTAAGDPEELREVGMVPAPPMGRRGVPKRCPGSPGCSLGAASVPTLPRHLSSGCSAPALIQPQGTECPRDTPPAPCRVRERRERSPWDCAGAGGASGQAVPCYLVVAREGVQWQHSGSRSPNHSAPLLAWVYVSCGGIRVEMRSQFVSGKLQNQSHVCHK